MTRIYNFSGGPATLPPTVLQAAAAEIASGSAKGYSILEMSHRSKEYLAIYEETKASLCEFMAIPSNYEVLFLHGGATLQFSMVPLNLLASPTAKADYVLTGAWSKKAADEARRFGDIHIAASSELEKFTQVPNLTNCNYRTDASYIHLTTNNTIFGTRLVNLPPENAGTLVGDLSSHILAEPVDVSRFGLIYAGAQKNIGTAGMAVVIVCRDLIGNARHETPVLLNYAIHSEKKSAYNTPPIFAIYLAGKVFRWALELGGVDALHQINLKKAALLYGFLDQSKLFFPIVSGAARSITNVTFRMHDTSLEAQFHDDAAACGLANLGGHRWVGGMRASLYNAMPLEGVEALVAFMSEFEKRHNH